MNLCKRCATMANARINCRFLSLHSFFYMCVWSSLFLYGELRVYLLSNGSFFRTSTNTLNKTFSYYCCCCCCCFYYCFSLDFHSTVIRLFFASFFAMRLLPSLHRSESRMNISKIYTLTNNDWMNSNVKAPHCTHHSSPTHATKKNQPTIPKTNETLTISLCAIAWVRLNEFIFSCYMPFFSLHSLYAALFLSSILWCHCYRCRRHHVIRAQLAMMKNRKSIEQKREKIGFFFLLSNKLTCHIFRVVAYLCNLKSYKSRTKTLLSFCERREYPIQNMVAFFNLFAATAFHLTLSLSQLLSKYLVALNVVRCISSISKVWNMCWIDRFHLFPLSVLV